MEIGKVNASLVVTIVITVLGWGITFGVCENKIESNARDIERLSRNQNQTDMTLYQINSQLAGLNAKMDLLLDGRITTK